MGLAKVWPAFTGSFNSADARALLPCLHEACSGYTQEVWVCDGRPPAAPGAGGGGAAGGGPATPDPPSRRSLLYRMLEDVYRWGHCYR